MTMTELQQYAVVNGIPPDLSLVLRLDGEELLVEMIGIDHSATYHDGHTRIELSLIRREEATT